MIVTHKHKGEFKEPATQSVVVSRTQGSKLSPQELSARIRSGLARAKAQGRRGVGGSFVRESATARDGSAVSPCFRACFEVSTLNHQPLVNVKCLDLTPFFVPSQLAPIRRGTRERPPGSYDLEITDGVWGSCFGVQGLAPHQNRPRTKTSPHRIASGRKSRCRNLTTIFTSRSGMCSSSTSSVTLGS